MLYATGMSRCDGYTMFFKEANAELKGVREMQRLTGVSLTDCQQLCRDDSGALSFECRSFRYNSRTQECLLNEADSYYDPGQMVTSPVSDFYQMICIQGAQPEGEENQVSR